MDARPVSERRILAGPAGDLEVLFEYPAGPASGVMLIGHPHPLYGGTLENKVAATLARAALALGRVAVRPNFRGVGASAGVHDDGVGETADFLFLMDLLPDMAEVLAACAGAPARLSLAGFSFGSFVVACAAQARAGHPLLDPGLVLVGAAAGKWPLPAVPTQSLVVHGERDETIPLTDVLDWARPQELPVVVLPGADHFFHRRLTRLRDLVVDHGLAAEARRGMTETLDG